MKILLIIALLASTANAGHYVRNINTGEMIWVSSEKEAEYAKRDKEADEEKERKANKQKDHVDFLGKMPKKERLAFMKIEAKYLAYTFGKKKSSKVKAKAYAKKHSLDAKYYEGASLKKVGRRYYVTFYGNPLFK